MIGGKRTRSISRHVGQAGSNHDVTEREEKKPSCRVPASHARTETNTD